MTEKSKKKEIKSLQKQENYLRKAERKIFDLRIKAIEDEHLHLKKTRAVELAAVRHDLESCALDAAIHTVFMIILYVIILSIFYKILENTY